MEGNDNYKENFLPFCSALSLCASVAFSQLVPNGVCSSPSLWVVFIEWQVVNTPPLLLLLQPLFYQHYSLLYFCCFELVFFLLLCSSRLAVVPIFHHFSTLDWLAPKSADSASFVSCLLLLHHQVVKELHSNPLLCLFSLLFSSRFRSIVEHEKKLEEKELCTGSIAQGPNKRNKKTSSHHFSYTSRRLS